MKKNLIVFGIILLTLVGILGGAVALYCFVYPLEYKTYIEKYAEEYQLDPALVASIINVESRFKPTKVSSKGAVGLMQLMPSTAQEVAEKLDIDSYDLFSPETNIQFGCYYLKYLTTQVGTDLTVLLASYNAGFNNVNDWLMDPEYSYNGVTLISTPYAETNEYIEKVNKNYRVYQARF